MLPKQDDKQTRFSHDGKLAIEDLLHTMPGHSRSRIFVSPGKDVLELLMRTVFKDSKEANLAVLLYSKCMKYNHHRGLEDLKAWLAAKCSVKGRSTNLALMAETGVVAPSVLRDGAETFVKRRDKKNEREE